jgi:tetratricopeptide (TPR) repeat protein
MGQPASAEAYYRESLALARNIRQRTGDTPDAVRDLAISLRNVASFSVQRHDWAQAEVEYREALELTRATLQQSVPTSRSLRDFSIALGDLGGVLRATGDLDGAQALYAESLALGRQLSQAPGAGIDLIGELCVSLNQFGSLTAELGDWRRAEASFREALSLVRDLAERVGDTPATLEHQLASLDGLAHLPGSGVAERAESLAICQRLVDRFPEVDRYREWLAALTSDNPTSAPPLDPSPA